MVSEMVSTSVLKSCAIAGNAGKYKSIEKGVIVFKAPKIKMIQNELISFGFVQRLCQWFDERFDSVRQRWMRIIQEHVQGVML